jgi:hypothetical protein
MAELEDSNCPHQPVQSQRSSRSRETRAACGNSLPHNSCYEASRRGLPSLRVSARADGRGQLARGGSLCFYWAARLRGSA